jgi:uncharacterized protein YndB with AHSA1/START domain
MTDTTPDRAYHLDTTATPDAVWAALTDPAAVRVYYFDTAPRTTWEVGSPVDYVDDDGVVQIAGVVTAFDPPRALAHTFVATWAGEPDDQGELAWEIEPTASGSRVTLVHRGGHGDETADGSQELLDALGAYLSRE